MYPGMTPRVFQMGITLLSTVNRQVVNDLMGRQDIDTSAPLLLSLISAPSQAWPASRVLKSALASNHEIGKLGIKGMFEPSVLVLFSYEGYPGVVGSPG